MKRKQILILICNLDLLFKAMSIANKFIISFILCFEKVVISRRNPTFLLKFM